MPENDNFSETLFPFEELVHHSSIIFYHCDVSPDFPLLFISPNVEGILGYRDCDFKENPKLRVERIHPQDKNQVLTTYRNIQEKQKATLEFRFKHRDGHYLWLQEEIKLVTDSQDSAHSIVGSSIEITEKRQTETKLRNLNKTLEKRVGERTRKLATANRKLKKQMRYRNKAKAKLKEQHKRLRLQELAIANLNDMVIITKAPREEPLESEIIFINHAFEKFTGYKAEEVIGRKPTFLHGPDTSAKVLKRIQEKIQAHEPFREEFINYKKDGTPYWVELDMSFFPTDEKEYEFWVGINRDITKRKQAEQKTEESQQRYRAFAELSFDAIFEISLDGTILNCNKKACDLFGYNRHELIGTNARELTPDEYKDSQPDIISDNITTGDEAWERTYKRKDGRLIPTEIHTQTYQIGDEQHLIAYVRDNSAHKSFENTINQSLKEKETLLAEVHHRVKNNLAIISGLLEMQAFNTDDSQLLEKLRESQSRIQSIAMVHEKLYRSDSFSKIAIDKYIDDLLPIIIKSMVNNEKKIAVKKDMESVFLNINQAIPCGLLLNEVITNCYKHAFTEQDEGTIWITLEKAAGYLTLSIKDNGKGLPEHFDIDNQPSLGMTLMSTLAKQLDGELTIASDNGSLFKISFEIS
ncbi:MAG: PAS domain S-box protein [Balneolaceae bacterium]|jgi:PAS domain S-box-containing protein